MAAICYSLAYNSPRCRNRSRSRRGFSLMRMLIAAALVAVLAFSLPAADKGTDVDWGKLRSTTPAMWKKETPSSNLRAWQFALEKAEGDKANAEVAVFYSPGGG